MRQLSPGIVSMIARQLGIPPRQASMAANALIPMLMAGMAKNSRQQPQGAAGLLNALNKDNHGGMLDDLANMALQGALGGGQQGGGGLAQGLLGAALGNKQQGGAGGLAGNLLGSLLGGGNKQKQQQEEQQRLLEQQRQQQQQQQGGGGLFGSIMDLLDGDGDEDEKLQKAAELRQQQLEEIERQQQQLSQQQLQQLREQEAAQLKAFREQHARASNGAGILNHVLGDKRHAIEKSVSKAAGISEAQAGQLAESLAPLLMGSIGKVQKQQNLDASGLQSLLDNEIETIQKKAPPKSGGSLLDLLDSDGDGDISNDLLGLASKFLR